MFAVNAEVDAVVTPAAVVPLATNPVAPEPPAPDVLISHPYPLLGADDEAVQDKLADVGEVYVIVRPVGGKQEAGVQIKIKPEVGKQEAFDVNLTVCALDVPAVVPFGAPQFGVASGTLPVNLLLLKSAFVVPLSPTWGT